MTSASKAGDVMTTGAATVRPEASLAEAARLLIDYRISGLPVVNQDGQLVGVVTEHDFLRTESGARPRWLDVLLGDGAGQITARELQSRKVQDVMSKNPISVDVETPVETVIETMERHQIKRLPVVRQGKVAGIISRANIVQALLRKADAASRSG